MLFLCGPRICPRPPPQGLFSPPEYWCHWARSYPGGCDGLVREKTPSDPASDTAPARSVGSHSLGHTGHRTTALWRCSAGARVCRGFPLEGKRSVCNDSLLLFPQDAAAAIDNMVRSLLLHHPVLVSLRLAEPRAALCGCEQGDAPGVGSVYHGPSSLLLRIRPSTIVPFPAPPLPAVLV